MAEDPQAARSEWGAEWREDLVNLVDPAVVDRCVVTGRTDLPPGAGVSYVGGVDPSGGSSDSMTFSVAHAEGEQRGVLDYAGEWPSPFSPESVVQEIVSVCRRYRITSIVGDRYAGEWAREPFSKHGIEYVTAPMTRSDYYLTLLPALNTPGRIELLDNRRLISQLCGLERRVGRGKDSVDHPRGAHDDIINASAIALVTAALSPQSSAEGWIAFYKGLNERAGLSFSRIDTDMDDVRTPGPEFGYDLNPPPLVTIVVPPIIAAEGAVNGHSIRRLGDKCVADMKRSEAAGWLRRSKPWRDQNPELCASLGIEESA
jgi:hypothetical protein